MFLARFHILQDEILPQRKLKLPEQQQYLWKRFLALLPDLLDAVTRLQSAKLQHTGGCSARHVGHPQLPAGLSLTHPQQAALASV